MTSQQSQESLETTDKNLRKRQRSATPPDSVQNNNETTSNDKSKISDITQNTKLSTGDVKVLLPFWNKYTQEETKKWWLPKRADCVDLKSSLWNGSLKKMALGSWYSVRISVPKVENLQENFSQSPPSPSAPALAPSPSPSPSPGAGVAAGVVEPSPLSPPSLPAPSLGAGGAAGSLQYLWQDIMEHIPLPTIEEDKKSSRSSKKSKKEVKKPPAGKVRRIRIYPNQEERLKLRKWIGTARWTYNRCLTAIEKEGIKRDKKDLRALCLNKKNFENTNLKWVLDTPYDIRDEAMNDLLKGYSSNFASNHKKFKMKFRSKKDRQQSIAILSKHWGTSRGQYSFLHKIKTSESLPENLEYDSRLVINRLGEFYLCIPRPLEIRAENQGPIFQKKGSGVVSLDPGVRTFMTGYDPSGTAFEWGKNDIGRVYRLCHAYDRLQSKRDQIHGKQNKRKRYRLRRVMLQIYKKIRCLINDCHCKLVKWLCENYRIILLPEFRTQGMIRRGQRRIGFKTARAMCTWSHYRFQQRLIHKAREHPWCQVVICTEEYTSKTCGFCGYIHKKLGGSKEFCCPQCKTNLDRDINGARNILLKYLTFTKKEKESA